MCAGTSCVKPSCREGLAKVCKVHAVELKMGFNSYMMNHTHIFTLVPSSGKKKFEITVPTPISPAKSKGNFNEPDLNHWC